MFFSTIQEVNARELKCSRPAGLYAVVTTHDLAGLGSIDSMAVDTNGIWFVCTEPALYAFSPNGVKLLIAGHKTRDGLCRWGG